MDCGAIIKYFKRKLGTRRDCKNHASPSYRRARKQNIPPNVGNKPPHKPTQNINLNQIKWKNLRTTKSQLTP